MGPYNIVYHHRTQGTGAEGVHIAYVVKGLKKLGHHVDVISPSNIDPLQTAGDNPYGRQPGLHRKLFNYLSRILPQFLFECLEMTYNWTAAIRLDLRLSKGKVDLMYERNAFFLDAGAKIARKYKVPFIVEVNEIAGEARVRKQVFVNKAKRIEHRVFAQADAIVVVSPFLKNKIAAAGIDSKKIHVIPNAADPEMFHEGIEGTPVRHELGIPDETVVFGFVGLFHTWHRLPELIRAFADVGKDQNARLLLVGDGVLRNTLQRLSDDLDIIDQVIFVGSVKYHDIPRYIAAMDIGVVPGSNHYRSPIKLFEYMAMGKAVLAPAFPPITSIISAGHSGHTFNQDDMASLREGIRRLLIEDYYRTRIGEAGRHTVLKDHTWAKNALRIIDIYETSAGTPRSEHNHGVAEL